MASHTDTHEEHAHHVVPLKIYFANFAALMVLLVITLGAAAVDLGQWNLLIAMAIAIAKAGLIMTFFMHLKWSSPLIRLFALITLLFLGIMFLFTLTDYVARGWIKL